MANKSEYGEVLARFLEIFPGEIDTSKAMELQQMSVPQFEGIFLAKLDQKIIGFLVSGIINQVSYISYLGVLARYRGQGVATALLEKYKSYLMQCGILKVRCTIRKDNKKTLGYIHYLGFRLL